MTANDRDALKYHEEGRPGKTEVVATKPCLTARDLALAYSPGVAAPCLAIQADPSTAYRYTNRGNLVAVLSNGTAVLGLGNIGPLAGKPVMEGKAVLFKRFAQIDVFDIELATLDPEEVILACKLLEPTFGGINLEDIRAPECFEIEERLKAMLKIPVFHDDQHGTAIISGAALINALEIAGKKIEDVQIVVNGAGASALACSRFFEELGAPRKNFLLVDTKGVVYEGRSEGMNKYKKRYARQTTRRTLAEAMEGADVFLGCSVADCLTPEMLQSMATKPIIFALANPDPEIPYDIARKVRPDAIVATGRSDYPNQVNNVLGFPFIFRGALDVRATAINEAMKVAAAHSLAALAREPVPEEVSLAYGGEAFAFGPDYIIPKPFDTRLLVTQAVAVAKAACDSGVAQEPITDWDAYRSRLQSMSSRSEILMRRVREVTVRQARRVVFPDGESRRVLEACAIIRQEGYGHPILLGDPEVIHRHGASLGIPSDSFEILDPRESEHHAAFEAELLLTAGRKGFTPKKVHKLVRTAGTFGTMMLRAGLADAMVIGAEDAYADTARSLIPLLERRDGAKRVAGFHLIMVEGRVVIIGDTMLNIEPDSKQLAEIALYGAELARDLGLEPRVAMLSFSNFGENQHPRARKVHEAVSILQREHPELIVDGEMHGDVAILSTFAERNYPYSRVKGDANVLIGPDLDSSNIACKLVGYLGQNREVLGPMIVGLKRPVNIVSYNSTVREIVNLAALGCYEACLGAKD